MMKGHVKTMKLTKTNIEKAKSGIIKDTTVPCLELRVLKSGKFFYIRKTDMYGVQRRLSLGQYGELTIEQARDKARAYASAMEAGKDPVKLLAQKVAANKTINELYDRWLIDHADTLKPKTKKDMIALWNNYVLSKIGTRRVCDIDSEDIEALLKPIKSIYAFNKVLALLSKAFNLAEKWKMRPLKTNPCTHISKHKEKKRNEYLSDNDFAKIIQACDYSIINDTEFHCLCAKAIKCLMFTGARHNEILQAKWSYYNELHGILHLPDSKTGEKTIALPNEVIEIINSIPRVSEYIFQSTAKDNSPIYSVKYTWDKVKEMAGIKPDLRIHDLRHNFASRLVSAGVSLHQVGELLGHTQAQTTKRYAHFMQEGRRDTASKVLIGVK